MSLAVQQETCLAAGSLRGCTDLHRLRHPKSSRAPIHTLHSPHLRWTSSLYTHLKSIVFSQCQDTCTWNWPFLDNSIKRELMCEMILHVLVFCILQAEAKPKTEKEKEKEKGGTGKQKGWRPQWSFLEHPGRWSFCRYHGIKILWVWVLYIYICMYYCIVIFWILYNMI